MNYLLKFCNSKKSLITIAILVAALIFFLFLSLYPLNSKAAADIGNFIRVKLDVEDKELWEFFALPNGQDDDFDVMATSYSSLGIDYDCALLLTEEVNLGNDRNQSK